MLIHIDPQVGAIDLFSVGAVEYSLKDLSAINEWNALNVGAM